MNPSSHLVLAYYKFVALSDPHDEVIKHKAFLGARDVASRIYISEEGINGQMSATRQAADEYIKWMKERPEFVDTVFKLHDHHEHVFPRLTIKYRKQLVALHAKVDLTDTGEHISPDQWQSMLENEKERILLDVRNDYEWKVGHFEGADLPQCETFREFNNYADRLKENVDPQKTPVMMYCTGGIRCELYSAILKKKGFEKVYQLDGGIINYGLKKGNKHWLGKLFVFDDRLAIPLSEKEATTIAKCEHCGSPNDTYYNCANMDCNKLFIACKECIKTFLGCCQEACKHSERLRPYQEVSHKPFRRKHLYKKD